MIRSMHDVFSILPSRIFPPSLIFPLEGGGVVGVYGGSSCADKERYSQSC